MADDPLPDQERRSTRALLLHPVNLIAGTIVGAVLVLIFCAIMGWDRGQVLKSLANYDFARGLITYIFAVGTIGVAVVLVVGGLLGGDETKERFARAKEVLALLLGIFGTMVGFYYGSELAAKEKYDKGAPLSLVPLVLSPSEVVGSGSVVLSSFVRGGQAPISFTLRTQPALGPETESSVPPSGLILERLEFPSAAKTSVYIIRLVVRDDAGTVDSTAAAVTVRVAPRP